jgi:two-component system OmpR family response regulator
MRAAGSEVAIIVITARDDVEDRILGLDRGADDYVVKPFEMAELLARVRAVSRRKGGQGKPVLTNGIISLDPATREAAIVASDTTAVLTHREFALLHALLIRPGVIRSRRDLEERIYGWGHEVESNAVEFLIHGLRRKLGPDTIKNIRGAGWMVQKRG